MDFFKRNSYLLAALLALLYCTPVTASEEAEEYFRHDIDSRVRYAPASSVKNYSGKIGILESEAEYSYELKASPASPAYGGRGGQERLPVVISLGTEYIDIESSVKEARLPSFLTAVTSDVETTLPFFKAENTYIRFGISPSFYSDGWDFDGNSSRLPSRVFLIYRPNPKLIFIGGVALFALRQEEVLPILGIIYKPNDKLTFNLTPDDPNISYALNDIVSLFVEWDLSIDEFAVGGANTKDVYITYDEWHTGGGMKFKFNKNFEASISAGGIFGRSLEYSDDRSKTSLKDGLYTELKVSVNF